MDSLTAITHRPGARYFSDISIVSVSSDKNVSIQYF